MNQAGTSQSNGTLASAAGAEASTPLARELLELDRPECLRLLATAAVGRIAVSVTEWEHPVIRPVNYVFDTASQSVLIRTAPGSKLHAVLRSARAAFEIDGLDPTGRIGWSVIIVGVSEEITNRAELTRIDGLGLEPWAPGRKGHWVRIRANTVSGRRIAPVGQL
jgi:hypothetical protein